MEPVGYFQSGGSSHHSFHHVARTCHYESHVGHHLKHLVRGLNKVFRALLQGNSPQEGNHLVFKSLFNGNILRDLDRFNCIVYRFNLLRVNMIFIDHYIPGKIAHRYYFGRGIHPEFFNTVHVRVNISSAPVKIGCMNVNHEGFTRNLHCGNTCRIGKPVVCMDNVEFVFFGNN